MNFKMYQINSMIISTIALFHWHNRGYEKKTSECAIFAIESSSNNINIKYMIKYERSSSYFRRAMKAYWTYLMEIIEIYNFHFKWILLWMCDCMSVTSKKRSLLKCQFMNNQKLKVDHILQRMQQNTSIVT